MDTYVISCEAARAAILSGHCTSAAGARPKLRCVCARGCACGALLLRMGTVGALKGGLPISPVGGSNFDLQNTALSRGSGKVALAGNVACHD